MHFRLLLAVALLAATQLALVHPLEHLDPATEPHSRECDLCVSVAQLGTAAPSMTPLQIQESPRGFTALASEHLYYAAFAPLFSSQAPPVS